MKQGMCYLVLCLFLGTFAGCQKDNPVTSGTGTTSLDDAAASIAGALGSENGGALDQMGDIAAISSAAGLGSEEGAMLARHASDSSNVTVSKSYDSASGWWTL